MTSDILTKNLPKDAFEKHGSKFYGKDKYYLEAVNDKEEKVSKKKAKAWSDLIENDGDKKNKKVKRSNLQAKENVWMHGGAQGVRRSAHAT